MYEAQLEFPEGWGVLEKNPFHGGGMDIFWNGTPEYLTNHLYFLVSTQAFKWVGDIPRLYHEKGFHNYAIENTVARWEGWVWYNWIALIDGKVGWNTDEYTMAFLHSDWL